MKSKQRKMLKGLVAVMIAVALVFSFGITAFAAGNDEEPDLSVENLVALAETYGPKALDYVYDYACENGYITEQAVSEVLAKVDDLKAQLEAAETPEEAYAICKAAVQEMYDYAVAAGLVTEETLEKVETFIADVCAYVEANEEAIVAEIEALVKEYGPVAVDYIFEFLYDNDIIAPEDVENAKDFVNSAKAALEDIKNMTCEDIKAIAEDIANKVLDYAEANGIVTREELAEAVAFAKEIAAYVKEAVDYIDDVTPEQFKEDAMALVKEAYDYAVENGYIDGEAVDAALAIIADVKEKIENFDADKAKEEIMALVNDAIAQIKALAEAKYADTVSVDYVVTGEDKGLVLGGDTAAGAGMGRGEDIYSELLEEELGFTVENAAKEELAYSELVSYIAENEEAIKEATLITYEIDACGFITETLAAEADWSAYLTEKQLEEAAAIVAQVKAQLAAKMDISSIEAVEPFIENAVLTAVTYAVESYGSIRAIDAINPDAALMVVGMYNPVRGLTATVNGEVIDLGVIFEYVIDATNAYYFTYAAIDGSFAFVDVSDAETPDIELSIDLDNIDLLAVVNALVGAADRMHANAFGHEYIKDQILGAINFIEPAGILGDADRNGEVDVFDAVCILDFAVGNIDEADIDLEAADFDQDGETTVFDAAAILEFVVAA